ncbi:hypothetical protein [Borrelia hermsii]|nr:hypothetical protein [Borrelia hermsii]
MRLDFHIKELNAVVDTVAAKEAGFDPKDSLFDDQVIAKKLQYYEHQRIKRKIYATLGNSIEDIQVLKSLCKELDLSIDINDYRYNDSETKLMAGVLYQLYYASAYAYLNLSLNFSEEKLALINKNMSSEKIAAIDLKLQEFIDVRENVMLKIVNKLNGAIGYKNNRDRMLSSLRVIAASDGPIALEIHSLLKISNDIGHLIRSL